MRGKRTYLGSQVEKTTPSQQLPASSMGTGPGVPLPIFKEQGQRKEMLTLTGLSSVHFRLSAGRDRTLARLINLSNLVGPCLTVRCKTKVRGRERRGGLLCLSVTTEDVKTRR